MEYPILIDLGIILSAAIIGTLAMEKLRLPGTLGQIIAGLAIGPFAFGLVHDVTTIEIFASLGAILLLFTIGFEFGFERLKEVGASALVIASFEQFACFIIGFELGLWLGFSFVEALFLGSFLTISSTGIISKLLMDLRLIKAQEAQVIIGILVIEDLFTVFILAFLSSAATVSKPLLVSSLTPVAIKATFFFVFAVLFGVKVVPKLLEFITKHSKSPELQLFSILALGFVTAYLGISFGFSPLVGAFIAGLIASEIPLARGTLDKIHPLRDVLAAFFFVSIGMMINLASLANVAWIGFIIGIAGILSKLVSGTLGSFISGFPLGSAVFVGVGLIPRGEFSIIFAKLGNDIGILGQEFYSIATSLVLVTALAGPLLLKQRRNIHYMISTGFLSTFVEGFLKPLRGFEIARFLMLDRMASVIRKAALRVIFDILFLLCFPLLAYIGIDLLSHFELSKTMLMVSKITIILIAMAFCLLPVLHLMEDIKETVSFTSRHFRIFIGAGYRRVIIDVIFASICIGSIVFATPIIAFLGMTRKVIYLFVLLNLTLLTLVLWDASKAMRKR
ncbi:MAG: cation:proton antiporter [Euryarchaeota archaeon]|nr:cation:proton antiporter [Euryarchaeota archaeon]